MGECFLERDTLLEKGLPPACGRHREARLHKSETEGAHAELCVGRESTPLSVWATSGCDTPSSKFELDVINLLICGPDFTHPSSPFLTSPPLL